MDDGAVALVEAEDVDALVVEVFGDAVDQGGADAVVDAGAEPLEALGLFGVGECALGEVLGSAGGQGALSGGGAAVADGAGEVAGGADESSVDVASVLPACGSPEIVEGSLCGLGVEGRCCVLVVDRAHHAG